MSLTMDLTRALLRLRPNPFRTVASMRKSASRSRPDAPVPEALRRSFSVTADTVRGHEVIMLTPRTGGVTTDLVYTHGGAYIHPLLGVHWQIIAALIHGTGARVTVPLYGLAPEHTADDAYQFLEDVYRTVSERAGSAPVFLVGDSAGAGLAIGQAILYREKGIRAPNGLLLFSPWVDVTMSNPGIAAVTGLDPILAPEGLAAAGADWAGRRDITDPLVSPLFDTLESLPQTSIYQGGHDIFLPDAKKFAAKAKAAGTRVDLRIYPAAFHVFVAAPWTPEARHALHHAADRIAAGRSREDEPDRTGT
ncbi:alpha/beta hydrolase fold domain-containing protein [Promicromonospora alba]|uniref:Alpha/beta hydrolase fold domain-containing protein n=1 Tax=Promicromonospora alba TaxID=1616110 RepID=A0ABV9HKI4_9MICO